MPYYREVLLSAWPSNLSVIEVGAPPAKIDQQLLAGFQQRDWGFYGKNTRATRRNQVEDTRKERIVVRRPSKCVQDILRSPDSTIEVVPFRRGKMTWDVQFK